MAKNFKFTWNGSGYDTLKKSTNIQQEVKKYADRVQQIAGDDFTVEYRTYEHWDGYVVKPVDEKAFYRNLQDNTLEKAWRAARA